MVATTKIDTGNKAFIPENSLKFVSSLGKSSVEEDDTYGVPLLTKEEYEACIEQGFQDIKEGKGREYTAEEFKELLGL